jgi:hypothetical protein
MQNTYKLKTWNEMKYKIQNDKARGFMTAT